MKHEWRKAEKALYLPGRKPELVEVPPAKYIVIDGAGDPNKEPFSERVGVLYGLAWTIRMMPKQGITPDGYHEYTMYPLEGVYDLSGPWDGLTPLDKDALIYTLMIRQPDFVTPEVYAMAEDIARKKKRLVGIELARLEEVTEGLCVQMTHIGPFDDEPASFAQMKAFDAEQGLERVGTCHREIYMSDPRKGEPSKYRTVLRYQVRRR